MGKMDESSLIGSTILVASFDVPVEVAGGIVVTSSPTNNLGVSIYKMTGLAKLRTQNESSPYFLQINS